MNMENTLVGWICWAVLVFFWRVRGISLYLGNNTDFQSVTLPKCLQNSFPHSCSDLNLLVKLGQAYFTTLRTSKEPNRTKAGKLQGLKMCPGTI